MEMTLLPQFTGKNSGGQGQKPATYPVGVWVGHCLWAAIYTRKSLGKGDDRPAVCKGDKDEDKCLQRKGNIAKKACMAEQVHRRSPGP